jgi:hypothetical protein
MTAVAERPQARCEVFGGGKCSQVATHLAHKSGWAPLAICDEHARYVKGLGWEVQAIK